MSFSPPSSFEPATVTVAGSVSVSNFPASVAVTGPLTSAQLAALEPLSVTGPLTDAQLRAAVVPVGDGGGSLTVDGPLTDAQLRAAVVPVGDGGGSLTVDGPLTSAQLVAAEPLAVTGPLTSAQLVAAEPLAVTGPLTDTQLRASAVPISAAALPLPSGAAKDSTLTDGTARVGGTVTVDGSGHTQPVSGTVAATQVTSPWVTDGSAVTQPVSADTLPLPDGAADNATLSEVALTAALQREAMEVA